MNSQDPRRDRPEAQWHLPASSGRDQLEGTFKWQRKNDDGLTLLCTDITIKGEFWLHVNKATDTSDTTPNYYVRLPQLLCDWRSVDELITQLDEWLESPKEISVDIGSRYQHFTVSFGKSDQLISSLDKPACRIAYSGGLVFQGEWLFDVDQSCIRIFRDELREALNSISSDAERRP